MPPAARITDFHACPMVNPGPSPHVGGPVVRGSPNVFTGSLPQARVGDMAVCAGPTDVIVKGSAGVFVNGMPAARLGDNTAHGGVITVGLPTVLIGELGDGGGGGGAAVDGVSMQYAAIEAQVQALIQAATSGTAFCEVCFEKAMAKFRHIGATAPVARAPAPAAAPGLPGQAPPPAAAQPLQTSKVCELVGHSLQCSHGRHPGPGGILMVVPGSNRGDVVSGKLSMKGGCGQHPSWSVSGPRSKSGTGAAYTFTADAPDTTRVSFFALQGVAPSIYQAQASACQSSAPSYEVRAYPPGKVSFKIGFTDFREALEGEIEKYLAIFDTEDEAGGDDEEDGGLVKSGLGAKKEFFNGYASYEGGWKEDKSWKAYYDKAWSIGFDPLASWSFKASIVPPTIAPEWAYRWFRAGLYGKVELSAKVAGKFTGKYWPDEDRNDWSEREVSGGGGLEVALSVELKLADPHIVEAALTGKCGGEVELGLDLSEEPGIKWAAKFSGVQASAKVRAFWGLVEFNRQFQLTPELKKDGVWSLTEADHQASGGAE